MRETDFISKEKLEEKGFENYHFFKLENSETLYRSFLMQLTDETE